MLFIRINAVVSYFTACPADMFLVFFIILQLYSQHNLHLLNHENESFLCVKDSMLRFVKLLLSQVQASS